jgi:hypothetical protein
MILKKWANNVPTIFDKDSPWVQGVWTVVVRWFCRHWDEGSRFTMVSLRWDVYVYFSIWTTRYYEMWHVVCDSANIWSTRTAYACHPIHQDFHTTYVESWAFLGEQLPHDMSEAWYNFVDDLSNLQCVRVPQFIGTLRDIQCPVCGFILDNIYISFIMCSRIGRITPGSSVRIWPTTIV